MSKVALSIGFYLVHSPSVATRAFSDCIKAGVVI